MLHCRYLLPLTVGEPLGRGAGPPPRLCPDRRSVVTPTPFQPQA